MSDDRRPPHPDSPDGIRLESVLTWFRARFSESPWWLQDELIYRGHRDGIDVCFWLTCGDVRTALGVRAETWEPWWDVSHQWRWTVVPKVEPEPAAKELGIAEVREGPVPIARWSVPDGADGFTVGIALK